MTRASAGVLVAIVVAAGLGLRMARIDVRPMHHDEANQAVKFGALLETGEYRYDAHDHHGPTLYYLTLPAAWMRGQHTLASLDEATLRGVTAAFGAATILLLPLLFPAIGRTAVLWAALLMAASPAMVFYSRMFIQESLFTCFTLAFAIVLGRLAGAGIGFGAAQPRTPGAGIGFAPDPETYPGTVVTAGVAAGLAIATKETAAIVLPAAVLACGIAWWSVRGRTLPAPLSGPDGAKRLALALGSAIIVAAIFYSSFLAHPSAVLQPLLGAGIYVERGTTVATHAHPWHYYVGLLAWSSSGGLRWSEALVLVLAAAGTVAAWLPRTADGASRAFWGRYLSAYALLAGLVFSAIPYKTPWNLLPFYAAAIVVAGIGASAILDAARWRTVRALAALVLLAGAAQLGWQAWRASVTYAADPRNPYVYAQTVPDAVRMAARIRALAALDPHGMRMQVSVVAPAHEQWPLPWYLRDMPNVGYWEAPGDPLAVAAPVIVASASHTEALDAALGERYASEYFGLRPDVLLALYVERGLYDRYLARIAGGDGRGVPEDDASSPGSTPIGVGPGPVASSSRVGVGPGPVASSSRIGVGPGPVASSSRVPAESGLKPSSLPGPPSHPTSAE